jgi:hypothetical protein
LDRVLDEEDELSELVEGRIVNIFYLFSQAENYVKEVVADRVVLKRKQTYPLGVPLLTSPRRSEGSPKDDADPSSHHVKVYQEPLYVVDNTGQLACRKRY